MELSKEKMELIASRIYLSNKSLYKLIKIVKN